MNIAQNNSDSEDETQATQILHGMLDTDSWRTSNTRGAGDESFDKELPDSSPLPVSRSLPSYDFQGLAQTQTQHAEQGNQGSQKENIDMRRGRGESPQKQSNAPRPNPTSDLIKVKGTKAVSFQSPRGKSNLHTSSTHRQPTRSTTYPSAMSMKHSELPASSQDSFGMVDDDPEQQFLATTKQFNVPLSELPDVVFAGRQGATSTKQGKGPKYHASGRSRRSSSPHEGLVLVAATPSVSGSSQSQQSQPPNQSELLGSRSEPVNQQSDLDVPHGSTTDECLSDAPSSNIYSNFGDHDDDRLPPTLEATQPSTQVDDDGLDANSVHPFDMPVPIPNSAAGSNNLLSMVDPRKRHRYQRHLDNPVEPPGLPEVQHYLQTPSQTDGSTGVTMEETQPSFEPETWVPPRRQFPARDHSALNTSASKEGNKTSTGHQTNASHDGTKPIPAIHPRKPESREIDASNHDIIPDSEPLRAGTTPNAKGITNQSPGKTLRQSHSRQGKEGSMPVSVVGEKSSNTVLGKHPLPVEEEEEEEEEEEVPLAAIRSNPNWKSTARQVVTKGEGKGSGKGQHINHALNPSMDQRSKSAPKPDVPPTRALASRPVKKQNIGKAWTNEEVPSSLPEQDLGKMSEIKRLPAHNVLPKAEGKATTKRVPSKPNKNVAAPVSRTRRHATVDTESSLSPLDDEASIPAADENDDTEPADDEYTNTDIAGPSFRKRKRNNPPARANKADTRTSNKTAKVPSTTPSTRQAKRLRSAAPISNIGGRGASRVFALWKQDGHYYPGTVYSHMGGSRYTVHFDDQTESVINIDQMRILDLRVGDDVLVPKLTRGVKVVDVSKFASSDLVSVRIDTGITEIPLEAIKIASRTISYAWKDRTMAPDTVITVVGPERVKPSPTPSKLSMLSGPSARGLNSSMFDKTAFIVTISPNGNPEKDKDGVMSAITNNGGTIINDWSDVIRMEGKHSHSNNRWAIDKSEAKWIGGRDIERVFLVADDSCLKPKFLIALALGVPCLSSSWLNDSVDAGEEKDWLAYMLPQGHSEALEARASQQVDVDWGNSIHQLDDIMGNRVPCKLFKGKSILCVGAEMVPAPKGKKPTTQEKFAQDARNAVTRIILAMGSDRVEAVTDVKYTSAPVSSYDFVVIKEDHHYGSHLGNGRTAHWSWVKDCLIASRLLSLPDWDQQIYESQDA